MKKLFLPAATAIVLASCSPSPANEEQGLLDRYERYLVPPCSYVCTKADGAIVVDGKLDEKAWEKAAWTEEFRDISGEGFAEPKYSTRAKMLWDDEYFYIGAYLEDPDIKASLTQKDTIIYYDNDFEIFIDPDGDGVSYFEFECNARAVLFDLMLDRPYRSGGSFLIPWNCEGIQIAVHHDGTLNNSSDTDKGWSVEWAIPAKSLSWNFSQQPIAAGKCWRVNFSRVQWLVAGGPEENWVWSPTGKVDMHMPDRWGHVYFSDKPLGEDAMEYDHPQVIYRLMWAMFHEQLAAMEENGSFHSSLKEFRMSEADLEGIPSDATISVESSSEQFLLKMSIPSEGSEYTLDHHGKFSHRAL